MQAYICSPANARVNISAQNIVNNEIQAKCDNKFDDEQRILKCIALQSEEFKEIKLNYPNIKVYKADFSGFGTKLILTPKEFGKNLIIDINGYYLYASTIYNLETCCNASNPLLILENIHTKNNFISDCNPCPASSELRVVMLNDLGSKPLIIDMGHNFTNQTSFGSLVSNDMNYDWKSLTWNEERSAFSVNASISGPPGGRASVRLELALDEKKWVTRLYSD